jgi:hypothetical protein
MARGLLRSWSSSYAATSRDCRADVISFGASIATPEQP